MLVIVSDFGVEGPYLGQVRAVLHQHAPGVPVIDLFNDLPAFDIRSAAYLLPAYTRDFPADTVFVCVVDPGVGGTRRPAIVRADGHWFVGPDNGLFHVLGQRAGRLEWWDITWRPATLSASFHGRDLFAPVAAGLARGNLPAADKVEPAWQRLRDWPDEYWAVSYIDRYGNAMTGVRAMSVDCRDELIVSGRVLRHARTFGEVLEGEAFWYENANGLVEIAVNRGSAARILKLAPGAEIMKRAHGSSRGNAC